VACAVKCPIVAGSGAVDYNAIIQACNGGDDTGCQKGFNASCGSIFEICPTCITGLYKDDEDLKTFSLLLRSL
jgi:hypothetical protein